MHQLSDQKLVQNDARFETLYGGRTNQVWKVLGGDGDRVLKLYGSSLQNPLFRNDAALEARCLTALEPTGFVPRLCAAGGYHADHWVLYDHAPGTPWDDDPAPVAWLLWQLHQSSVRVAAPAGCNGSADLAGHGQDILDLCAPETRDKLLSLRPNHAVAPTAKLCLIHGDPVPGNILVAASGLTLIDWQCPALGDPCEDLAMFLSPAMQLLYRGGPLEGDQENRFLSAYGEPDVLSRYEQLRPWFAWRMAAYCLWRMENGAPDYERGFQLEVEALC